MKKKKYIEGGRRIVNNVGDYNNLQEMKMEWKKKKKYITNCETIK
jgi:hypothetical protein